MSRIIFLALQALGFALIATALALMAGDPWDPGCSYGAVFFLGCAVLVLSIAPAAIAFKRLTLLIAIAGILTEFVGAFFLLGFFNASVVAPKRQALVLSDPVRFVADARQLMANVKEQEQKAPDGMPATLRIPHLRYAKIYPDHVDLVTWRNPDMEEGFRVWSATWPHRVHHDRPTRYRDIFSYDYNNDVAESPDNIP
jgi:hypothetical protein